MTHWRSASSVLALIVGSSLLLALGIGCSSSPPATTSSEEPSPSPSGPALSLLYTTAEAGLVLHDARQGASRTLVPEATAKGPRAVSPTGKYLAFTYATPDSSHLALLDLTTQTLRRVHARPGTVTYSLAWHPNQDQLAFGHYRPTDDGRRGPGGIRIVQSDGTSQDVGCSTVREVLHWLPDGSLATRTADNLYVVGSGDCATQASVDARRMHHIHYAPNGRQMAYIYRELKYDREAGDYLPDSSLVLSGPRANDTETLFGNERRARHLRWSPDGAELAFDVAVQTSGHRQVVVYNGDRTTYLVSPDQTTTDQVHPRWSPSGGHLAFTLRTAEGPKAAVRVKGQLRQLGPTTGPVWGWLDDRSVVVPGPDSLRVKELSGTTRFAHPTPESLLHIWRIPVS